MRLFPVYRLRSLFAQRDVRQFYLVDSSTSAKPPVPVYSLVDEDEDEAESQSLGVEAQEVVRPSYRLERILIGMQNIRFEKWPLLSWTEKDRHNALLEVASLASSPVETGSVQQTPSSQLAEAQRLQSLQQEFSSDIALQATYLALRHRPRTIAGISIPITLTFQRWTEAGTDQGALILDKAAISALQLFPTTLPFFTPKATVSSKSGRAQSLFQLLDRSRTSMGRRQLRSWLQRPSGDRLTIVSRQSFIAYLMQNSLLLSRLTDSNDHLRQFPDLDRLIQRLVSVSSGLSGSPSANTASLKDLLELYRCVARAQTILGTLQEVPLLEHGTSSSSSSSNSMTTLPLAAELASICSKCGPLLALVEEVLDAEHLQSSYDRSAAAASTKSTALSQAERLFRDRFLRVKPSLTTALTQCHDVLDQIAADILAHFEELPSQLSIDTKELHLERSHVHGIHLRVTKRLSATVLKALDKQKIGYNVVSQQKAGTLFLTKTLETLLSRHTRERAQYDSLQAKILLEAMNVARTYVSILQQLTQCIGRLDTLCGLAMVALEYDWTLPQLSSTGGEVVLEGLYHPLLRERIGATATVSSDVHLVPPTLSRIITGPNMGGKSTLLKAVGLTAVLVQLGSAVPCRRAILPIYDRIFLRSGSAESVLLGSSSFMTEMTAVSEVLRLATPSSLVLIDELGRGTSTADGFGLAWAVLEELALHNRSQVLCATHFHELSALEDSLTVATGAPLFRSWHVDAYVNTATKEIAMLYALKDGSSSRSYGIHCAEIAGFPVEILKEARAIEAQLAQTTHTEEEEVAVGQKRKRTASSGSR